MKRKWIFIVITIILTFSTMSSCARTSSNNNNMDKIQLWHYHYADGDYPDKIIESVKEYCERKNIPLELCIYEGKTISMKDYILKRNVSLAHGNNGIVMDDIRLMEDLIGQHADYTKLDNYKNLFDSYKDRFIIPIGLDFLNIVIENEAIEYYDINIPEKPVIIYSEYLEIKQQMKEKGARFEANAKEYIDTLTYYLNKNKLLFADKNSEIIKDSDKFKETLKRTIIDVYNDIILYGDVEIIKNESGVYYRNLGTYRNKLKTYDKNSEITLCYGNKLLEGIVNIFQYNKIDDYINKTFVIYPYDIPPEPCFFMHKNITNKKIYDLANYIVNESSYFNLTGSKLSEKTWFAPTLNTRNIREGLHVDSNLEVMLRGSVGKTHDIDQILSNDGLKKIINSAYDTYYKNKDTSREAADYYFYYTGIARQNIELFIDKTVMNIYQKLSENQSSLVKLDVENEEIIKMIDVEINEFVTNFYLYND